MSNPTPPPGPEDPTGSNQPAPANPYGTPPPAYGQPTPYGQPAPYGQPPAGPGYPAYGQPAEEKGKGLAIAALVLAFIPCLNLVGFVLALVVLIGKKAGKGLAIAALVVSLAWAAIFVVLVLVAGSLFGTPIDDLKTGQCFNAEGLTGDGDGVSSIDVVGCGESHDAEVLGTNTLDADEAEAYRDQNGSEACGPLIEAELIAALPEDVTVTALTQSEEPDEGDLLACVAYQVDGKKLTEKIG
jgi:hypothetical protein